MPSSRSRLCHVLTVSAVGLLAAATAHAAGTPAQQCQAGKDKRAGKYAACRQNAEAKLATTGDIPKYTDALDKCATKFSIAWQKLEDKATAASAVCPADETVIKSKTDTYTDSVAALLAGDVPVSCGNTLADGDDQCDGTDLDGQTCQGLGYTLAGTLTCTAGCAFDTSACLTERIPATGQTTSYGAGDDGDLRTGAALAYVDNEDGTITDSNTGLMWEKKVQFDGRYTSCSNEMGTCANPHDANNVYTWSAGGTNYDGGVVTIFLNQLNNRCNKDTTIPCTIAANCTVPGGACGFAGHRDWRLPSKKELQGIIDDGKYNPALDGAFSGTNCGVACTDLTNPRCSCDAVATYWSATTVANNPTRAWPVGTSGSYLATCLDGYKPGTMYARAVRGGS